MDLHSTPLVLDLPPEVMATLRRQAQAAGLSPRVMAQQLLRDALAPRANREAARTSDRAEERAALLAPVRARLSQDLSSASGWADLQTRLSRHGYTLRERGGGLALYCTKTAKPIAKASELGWSYASLMRRFQAPFPGHAHTHLATRILGERAGRNKHHPDLFQDPGDKDDDDDDDIVLIEPC